MMDVIIIVALEGWRAVEVSLSCALPSSVLLIKFLPKYLWVVALTRVICIYFYIATVYMTKPIVLYA